MTATQKAVIENVRCWARTLNNPVDIIINEFSDQTDAVYLLSQK